MLRRILLQIGLLAGCAACALTFWRLLAEGNADILQVCLRAIGAGAIMLVLTLFIHRVVEKLGGSPVTRHPEKHATLELSDSSQTIHEE